MGGGCPPAGLGLIQEVGVEVSQIHPSRCRGVGCGRVGRDTPSLDRRRRTSRRANREREAGSYIVHAKSASDLEALKSELRSSGARVEDDLSQINAVAVSVDSSTATASGLQSSRGLAREERRPHLIDPEGATARRPTSAAEAGARGSASSFPGLMWNLDRINAQEANAITMGDGVTVGVADTGLDFTHSELAGQIAGQQDFTPTEDPPLCKTFFGFSPTPTGRRPTAGRPNTDWNGHGSWIGGNIAAALDGVGHQRHRAEGEAVRPEDLAVVRLGVRLRDPRRVHRTPPTTASTSSASRSAATSTAATPTRTPIYQAVRRRGRATPGARAR